MSEQLQRRITRLRRLSYVMVGATLLGVLLINLTIANWLPRGGWAYFLVYGSILVGLLTVSCLLNYRDLRRRYLRQAPHKCRSCGYDLTGNMTGTCPECGSPICEKP